MSLKTFMTFMLLTSGKFTNLIFENTTKAEEDCIRGKSEFYNESQGKFDDWFFILLMMKYSCMSPETYQIEFNSLLINEKIGQVSIECIEVKLKPLLPHFTIFKNVRPSKSEKECEDEISIGEKSQVQRITKLKEKLGFNPCDEEYYEYALLEDYLFKYIQVKRPREREILLLKNEHYAYSNKVIQNTLDCIFKKLNDEMGNEEEEVGEGHEVGQ